MTSVNFAYWLQGFFEINDADKSAPKTLSQAKVEIIKKHLNLVFLHEIDPSQGDAEHQQELNSAHGTTLIRC
jgi:hypothetical protein